MLFIKKMLIMLKKVVDYICTKEKNEVKILVDKFCMFLTNRIRKEMPEVDDERAEIIMYGLQNIIGEMPKGIIILIIAYFSAIFANNLIIINSPFFCKIYIIQE